MLCFSGDAEPSDAISWPERDCVMHYVICKRCGLKYMTPRPTERWYLGFYAEHFWQEKVTWRSWSSKGGGKAVRADEGTERRVAKQRWRAQRIDDLTSCVAPIDASSLVLDVGTAFGETLVLLRNHYGCRVLGVEPSELGRQWCTDVNDVPLVGRTMEDLAEPQPFDGEVSLLIMSHVLENIVNPRRALESARRLLSPQGFIYVDTCNFYYNNAVNPYHPYIFSPETLVDLLGQVGFRLVAQHAEIHPSQAELALDPYLAVVATPGPPAKIRRHVDVNRLVAAQARGLGLLAETKALFKTARNQRSRRAVDQ